MSQVYVFKHDRVVLSEVQAYAARGFGEKEWGQRYMFIWLKGREEHLAFPIDDFEEVLAFDEAMNGWAAFTVSNETT